MEAYGYQQQHPDYPRATPAGNYAPPPGVGPGQPPRTNPQNRQKKTMTKCAAISDLVISSIVSGIWLLMAIFAYPYFAVILLAHAGSITASALFLAKEKKWVVIFWMFWNIFRIIVELVGPILCAIYWFGYLSRHYPTTSESEHTNRGLLQAVGFTLWILLEIGLFATYITFVVIFGRYWCSFSESNETGLESQPPPTAPYGQPLYVQRPPEYQYQNPPAPRY